MSDRMHKTHQLSISVVFIILFIVMILYEALNPFPCIDTFVDAKRCGVDLPPCVGEHVRCINGYCRSDLPATLPAFSPLPMAP